MIEFTFAHRTMDAWSTVIDVKHPVSEAEAFDEAVEQYREAVFPDYVPSHPDVTVFIKRR